MKRIKRLSMLALLGATLCLSVWARQNPAPQTKPAPPPPPQLAVKVGDAAPDFTLRSHEGKEVKLSDFKGKKNVILAFYVLAFTGG